jgi:hypothetical protein
VGTVPAQPTPPSPPSYCSSPSRCRTPSARTRARTGPPSPLLDSESHCRRARLLVPLLDPLANPSRPTSSPCLAPFLSRKSERRHVRPRLNLAATVPRSSPRRVPELRRRPLLRLHRLDRAEDTCFVPNTVVFHLGHRRSPSSIRSVRPPPSTLWHTCRLYVSSAFPSLSPWIHPCTVDATPQLTRARLRGTRRRRLSGDLLVTGLCSFVTPHRVGPRRLLHLLAVAP